MSGIQADSGLLAQFPAIPKSTSRPDTEEGSIIHNFIYKKNKDEYYIMKRLSIEIKQSKKETLWAIGEERK